MQPTKLKIHIKGVSLQRAHDLISACIDNNNSLVSLRLLLDPACDCIQVDRLRVAGVPVGSPEFIANYVRSKALDIVQDVEKLRIMENDPLVHYNHLVKICQHTLSILRELSRKGPFGHWATVVLGLKATSSRPPPQGGGGGEFGHNLNR